MNQRRRSAQAVPGWWSPHCRRRGRGYEAVSAALFALGALAGWVVGFVRWVLPPHRCRALVWLLGRALLLVWSALAAAVGAAVVLALVAGLAGL